VKAQKPSTNNITNDLRNLLFIRRVLITTFFKLANAVTKAGSGMYLDAKG
jgi:hypothetical protein